MVRKSIHSSVLRHLVGVTLGLFLLYLGLRSPEAGPGAIAQSNTPPVISNVKVAEVNITSTLITWSTDVLSDATVNFGVAKNLGIAREARPLDTDHEVLVTDLDPSTTYFFRVVSADLGGNQTFSPTFTFTTKGRRPIPETQKIKDDEQRALTEKIVDLVEQVTDQTALEVISDKVQQVGASVLTPPRILGEPKIEVGADQATVSWETDKDANGVLEFARDSEFTTNGGQYTRKEGDATQFSLKHKVTIFGLSPETLYHLRITSKPQVGPVGASDDLTFTTKSFLPVISNIRLLKVQEDSATVSWSTQVPAGGLIEYTNVLTKETKSIGDPAMQIAHTIQLANLRFKNTYRMVIKARTASGDEIASQPITFTTVKDEAPPLISQVNNESTLYPDADTKVQTIVSWETDELSQCQLHYSQGLSTDPKDQMKMPEETGFSLKHVSVITEFSPSTAYKFWVQCKDRTGNEGKSEDFVLYTPDKEKNIIDIIIENFQGAFGWVKNIGGGAK